MSATTLSSNVSFGSLLGGLLTWWGCHEASGNSRLDSSGNGNVLAEAVSSVASAIGLVGNASSFDATANHYLRYSNAVVTSGAFTFSLWFKPTDFGASRTWMTQTAGAVAKQIFSTDTSGNVSWSVDGIATSLSATITAAAWHHLVGVYDGSGAFRLYVDGKLAASGSATAIFTGTSLTVGAAGTGGSRAKGLVQMIGVWSRALSDGGVQAGQAATAEVAALYNNGIGLDYPFSAAA